MNIDHILYLSSLCGRSWVCQITECDGRQRIWRVECPCVDERGDAKAKEIVMDEAFRQFNAEIASELLASP